MSAENRPLVYGLVMAGGMSSRMTRDKAALAYHGQPQVRHCAALLSALVTEVFVSVREAQQDDEIYAGLNPVVDRYADIGPMSGVLSAFDVHPEVAWCVLACDLPFVNAAILEELFSGRDAARQATAFMATDGFFEPLCAIYEPSIAASLRAQREAGDHSLRGILTECDVRLLCAPDDRALTNVNTPEEQKDARSQLTVDGSAEK